MSDDLELLRRYATTGSEPDFAELVRRHLGLVYHTALRHLNGDAHGAEDVAQEVFSKLALKAGMVSDRVLLAGWLHTSARNAALHRLRTERRRREREQEAYRMQEIIPPTTESARWEQLRPYLDEVLHSLGDRDREAVLMHFLEGRPIRDVAARLDLTPQGARSRIDRALERMQARFTRHGITSTVAALEVALGSQAVAAVPTQLAAAVTASALGAATTATTGTIFTLGVLNLMKASTALLAASFALNLIVGGIYLTQRHGSLSGALPPDHVVSAPQVPSSVVAALDTPSASTNDLPSLVERLRAAGFPSAIIQRTVQDLLLEKYAARYLEAVGLAGGPPPYWEYNPKSSAVNGEITPEIVTLMLDWVNEVKLLMGDSYQVLEAVSGRSLDRIFGNLSPDKIAEIWAIQNESMRRTTVGKEPWDVVQREERSAIEALLTPDEQLEYDLHASPTTTQTLRRQLAAFDPSEAEYRAIFEQQAPFDRTYNVRPGFINKEAELHRPELQEKIGAVLGPERAADYRLSLDPTAPTVAALAYRLGLPMSAARDVLRVKTDVEKRAATIRGDGTLETSARSQQLGGLADDAAARVAAALGARGLELYRQSGGSWLTALRPVPAAPSARN